MAHGEDLTVPLILLTILYIVSIFYFHFVEGWSYLDAAYFTTTTITTVGYGDLAPQTEYGKIGAIVLTFFGVSIAFYIITHLGHWREKTLDEKIRKRLEILKEISLIKKGRQNDRK